MALSIPATRAGDGLRPVNTAHDLPQIVDLLRLVFGDSLEGDETKLFGEGAPGPVNELYVRFHPSAQRLANGFVWQADGRIIGNATLLTTKTWDRFLVANVAVHPAYRRQGIARHLMQAITTSVRNRGGREILLQVVKDNQSAIDLYLSLGYAAIGNMTTWYATGSRVRPIPETTADEAPSAIIQLPEKRWREAYELDTAQVHPDLNWPEPLPFNAYRRSWWQKGLDFMNGRHFEGWTTLDDDGRLIGLVTLAGEWGRSYLLTLRVHPDWRGTLERPLLAKALRRLHYLPRRNVRVDHLESDQLTGQLLQEAHFTSQRTLTHMRLAISR
jgi:ribosomal protein S18 acetylase RimI-like enzyme